MTDNSRELKTYYHPIHSVLVPAMQAAVSSVAGFLVTISVAIYFRYPAGAALAVGGLGAGLTFGAAWLVSLLWWRSRVEATTTSTPTPAELVYPVETEAVRVDLYHNSGPYYEVDRLEVPFPRDMLIRAAGALHDRGWETSNLGGANKPLTRSQAEALRDWLISEELAGWFREDSHTIGWYLNERGRAILRRFYHAGIIAGDLLPPPPAKLPTPAERYFEGLQTHTNPQTTDLIDELWQR